MRVKVTAPFLGSSTIFWNRQKLVNKDTEPKEFSAHRSLFSFSMPNGTTCAPETWRSALSQSVGLAVHSVAWLQWVKCMLKMSKLLI